MGSQVVYFFINNDMRDAERYCKENGISDDVLADAIKEFKQIKSKVCKVKAENMQKFSELKEAIRLAIVYQLYRTRRIKNMKSYKLENNDTDFLRINALWDIYKKIIYRYKGSIYFDAYNNLNIPTEIIIQDINILETVRQELLTLFSSQYESFCRAFNSLIKTEIEELNRYLANNSCREWGSDYYALDEDFEEYNMLVLAEQNNSLVVKKEYDIWGEAYPESVYIGYSVYLAEKGEFLLNPCTYIASEKLFSISQVNWILTNFSLFNMMIKDEALLSVLSLGLKGKEIDKDLLVYNGEKLI